MSKPKGRHRAPEPPKCDGADGPSNDCCEWHGCVIPLLYFILAFLVGLAVGHGCK